MSYFFRGRSRDAETDKLINIYNIQKYNLMKIILLLLYFFRVCFDGLAETEITGSDFVDNGVFFKDNVISSTLYRTVKKYFCSVRNSNESELLVYGSKQWSFPAQDVRLNLDYPEKNSHNSIRYLLTEVAVIVHFEGTSSSGFITSGGMMRDHISMKFLFSNITRILYQFNLYGVPVQFLEYTENFSNSYDIC